MAWIDAAKALSPASFWVPDDLCASAWTEHAPFGFWLAGALGPRCFVELGAHNGFSFLVFCQAIERLSLGATAYAVDTWKGDEHAGFYDEAVFGSIRERSARYGAFATLVRSSFDEALTYFADGSIDLLHIDGRHGYDDVKHDYLTWAGKLSRSAIVLFHDINVRERGFGAWRFFDEVSANRPCFRFHHGHGLGILASGEVPPGLAPLFDAPPDTADLIRAAYSALGGSVSARQGLAQRNREVAALRDEVSRRGLSTVEGPRQPPTTPDPEAPAVTAPEGTPGEPATEAPAETSPAASPSQRKRADKTRVTAAGRAVRRRS